MSTHIREINLFVDVKGEEPLWDSGVEGHQQFVPDWAKVMIIDGKVSVIVSGPLLNAKGQPYKTKRGLMSYDEDPENQGIWMAPKWVATLMDGVKKL